MKLLLKNHTSENLFRELNYIGVSLRIARQIQGALFRNGFIPESIQGVSKVLTKKLILETQVPNLEIVQKAISPTDGFTKYLFRSGDGAEFEAVRIPIMNNEDKKKYSVCVSSQVGCLMGCSFCETGRIGFKRDLEAWEIVDQVVKIQADSEYPVKGVVFMGMGEPMMNYDSVVTAAKIMSEPCGMAISGKAISISTCGIIDGVRRFIDDKLPFRLIVSLTSANPAMRRALMPVEESNPTNDLIELLRKYHAITKERVTLAWTMISGINTSEKDAIMLASLTKWLPVKIDLIDVNDPSGQFTPPSEDELNAFRDYLRKHLGMPVSRRYSGGKDVFAACGMLANSKNTSGR